VSTEEPTSISGAPRRSTNSSPVLQDNGSELAAELKSKAVDVLHRSLDRIRAALDAGELDFDDVRALLPPVHRVLEHAERMEVARDDSDGLPVVHIIFNLHGGVSVERVDAAPSLKAIDAPPVAVREEGQRAPALSVEFLPLDPKESGDQ
jgi:hypothetical protein